MIENEFYLSGGFILVIWLIGISGAGKTTLASGLFKKLKKPNNNWVFLDGDLLRDVWGDTVSHSIEGRALNAHRISHLCKMLDDQGLNVVASVLSIFPEWQEWNRKTFSSYFQIFLDIPIELAIDRDTKGIYSAALKGEINNVVGIDIDFPRPTKSDLVIDSSGGAGTAEELASKFTKLSKKSI